MLTVRRSYVSKNAAISLWCPRSLIPLFGTRKICDFKLESLFSELRRDPYSHQPNVLSQDLPRMMLLVLLDPKDGYGCS